MANQYEKRVEVRKIVEWFLTGEIKKTEPVELKWVDNDSTAPPGFVYCPVSTHAPEALEMNFRRKAQ